MWRNKIKNVIINIFLLLIFFFLNSCFLFKKGQNLTIICDTNLLQFTENQRVLKIKEATKILEKRLDQLVISSLKVTPVNNQGRIKINIFNVKYPKDIEDLISFRGEFEFKLVDDNLSKRKNFNNYKKGVLKKDIVLPNDKEILFYWAKNPNSKQLKKKYPLKKKWPIIVHKEPFLTSLDIKKTEVFIDQFDCPAVNFTLYDRQAEIMYKITKENFKKMVAIVLDKKIISYPQIREPLHSRGMITGHFTLSEARILAVILKSGPLPIKLRIIHIITNMDK